MFLRKVLRIIFVVVEHYDTWRRREQHIMISMSCTGKRPLGRPWCRWECESRMDLKEIGIHMRNWVDSAQGRDFWRAFV